MSLLRASADPRSLTCAACVRRSTRLFSHAATACIVYMTLCIAALIDVALDVNSHGNSEQVSAGCGRCSFAARGEPAHRHGFALRSKSASGWAPPPWASSSRCVTAALSSHSPRATRLTPLPRSAQASTLRLAHVLQRELHPTQAAPQPTFVPRSLATVEVRVLGQLCVGPCAGA